MPQPTMLFAINMVMLRELFIERRWAAALAGEGEEQLAERVNNILSVLITWLEKVEYEWATILLGDNSLLFRDFLFITCCWFFGSVRIIFRNNGRNMQQSSLFYFFQLFSSITTVLLSLLLLLIYPHAFATNMNQSTRHLGTLVFYFVSLSQALLLLACCYLRQRD